MFIPRVDGLGRGKERKGEKRKGHQLKGPTAECLQLPAKHFAEL